MNDRTLDDIRVGETWVGRPLTLTEADVIGFGRAWDPQPFHVDSEAAQTGPFGGLVASGWHLAALTMREFVDANPYGSTPLVGIGVDELRWLAPARVGDTIVIHREIIEARASRTRPDRGVLRTQVRLVNQHEVCVMRFIVITQMPVRRA